METAAPATGTERRLESLNAPALRFDLDDEVNRLWEEKASRFGRHAKTLVKHRDFRLVLTVLKAGQRIKEHKASGRISIQTVWGCLRVRVSPAKPELVELPPGHLLVLDRAVRHEVEALADSAFLLTVAWPEGKREEAPAAASSGA